uniref:Ras-associating domain-containing protein n=1 Tax=Ditylenchus dipsaci TaxID=166011 RepID=A0A915DV02_9BILA
MWTREWASVRLKITNETTAQEIVALVVEQISKITTTSTLSPSGQGGEPEEDCRDFCLVAVVGARERRLRDTFSLLNLQAPWNKGKLFVRHVNCISSAIQFGNEALV